MHVEIAPGILQWACLRAGLDSQIVARKLPQLSAWERGERKPTLKQLEQFAKIVHVPIGFLFLSKPPQEQMPIPDFRTLANEQVSRPSPDLLETIYLCQQRQEWYRTFSISIHEDPLPFVGSASLEYDIVGVAQAIRETLNFKIEQRRKLSTWEDALREFISQCDAIGILVMVSGVVGSNTHRQLDYNEFRGFALVDEYAPVIFINGKDTKSAQMFTLAHELAHVWLGESGVTDAAPVSTPSLNIEKWCNQVAAEILVPLKHFKGEFQPGADKYNELTRLSRIYKVSTLVILRRIYDARFISYEELTSLYDVELNRLVTMQKGSGGNYYLTQPARVSKRFARAVITSTLEGQTLHREAFQLLGIKKVATFRELGDRLGIA